MMQTFNPKNTTVTIDGKKIEGFASDSAVEMQEEHEYITVEVGADGKHARFASPEGGGTVKVTLFYNSESAKELDKMILQRHGGQNQGRNKKLSPITGSIRDEQTGRSYNLQDGEVITGPIGVSYAVGKANDRMYTFDFEKITPQLNNAQTNAPSPTVPGGGGGLLLTP